MITQNERKTLFAEFEARLARRRTVRWGVGASVVGLLVFAWSLVYPIGMVRTVFWDAAAVAVRAMGFLAFALLAAGALYDWATKEADP